MSFEEVATTGMRSSWGLRCTTQARRLCYGESEFKMVLFFKPQVQPFHDPTKGLFWSGAHADPLTRHTMREAERSGAQHQSLGAAVLAKKTVLSAISMSGVTDNRVS